MITVGMTHKEERVVEYEHTAAHMGSGAQEVFATPMMIALMEFSAMNAVAPYLAEGQATVGTEVNVKHLGATPVGMKVCAECELIEFDRRRLVFKVTAYDEVEKIGEGVHERFIIDVEKFMAKTQTKMK